MPCCFAVERHECLVQHAPEPGRPCATAGAEELQPGLLQQRAAAGGCVLERR